MKKLMTEICESDYQKIKLNLGKNDDWYNICEMRKFLNSINFNTIFNVMKK